MKRSENVYEHNSKRPKLDFGNKKTPYTAHSARPINEWDDEDFNGDVLEEVCIIAELSQVIAPHRTIQPEPDTEKVAAENQRLKEALKTKEGEVGILRSQLKQNQNAKQNEAVNNLRNIDKIETKFKGDVDSLKKQIERLQSELEFKDLEVKGLIEKCKQLEVKSPNVHFYPPASVSVDDKHLFSLSQAISSKNKTVKRLEDVEKETIVEKKDVRILYQRGKNDGEKLSFFLNPSIFQTRKEPSVISMYPCTPNYRESTEHAKNDKYKWIGLPKHIPRIESLHPLVMELVKTECFSKPTLEKIRSISVNIFQSLVEILKFLNKFPIDLEKDKALLEDTDPGKSWTLKDLLSNELLGPEEKAVEARRTLGILCCIGRGNSKALQTIASNNFLNVLHEITFNVQRLRRPLEFSGVLAGILLFLQIWLAEKENADVSQTAIELAQKTLCEIILARPKLNILREVINALTAAAHIENFSSGICNKSKPENIALFMDFRLQRALFFSNNACPLKLLQIQIKTLAHLCNSTSALIEITHAFTCWLHSAIAYSTKPQIWLFPDNDHCCNVLECFCYLLSLCIPMSKDLKVRQVFERGIITLRDCCKDQKKKIKMSTLKLLPSRIRGSCILEMVSGKTREAIYDVISDCESEGITQDNTVQNAVSVGMSDA